MKFTNTIVIIDLEASCKRFGHNEVEESNIIEIGAVKLDKRSLEIIEEFSTLIKPADYPILPEITEITGISGKMVKDQPGFREAAEKFVEWYGKKNKSLLAGWGLYYDLPLLRKEFRVCGLEYSEYFVGGGFDIKGLGYYWLAKHQHSTTGVSVEKMVSKMGIDLDFPLHRALNDARAAAAILKYIAAEDNQ